jgi:hypothetical protein
MNVDPNFCGPSVVELRPAEGRRLVFDVPNAEIKWENGIARIILPADAVMIVKERRA